MGILLSVCASRKFWGATGVKILFAIYQANNPSSHTYTQYTCNYPVDYPVTSVLTHFKTVFMFQELASFPSLYICFILNNLSVSSQSIVATKHTLWKVKHLVGFLQPVVCFHLIVGSMLRAYRVISQIKYKQNSRMLIQLWLPQEVVRMVMWPSWNLGGPSPVTPISAP